MSKISNLNLARFGTYTIYERVKPVNRTDLVFLNLLKEPEFKVSADLIEAIDHFIYNGLLSERTHAQLKKMIAAAFNEYRSLIGLKLGITSDTLLMSIVLKDTKTVNTE